MLQCGLRKRRGDLGVVLGTSQYIVSHQNAAFSEAQLSEHMKILIAIVLSLSANCVMAAEESRHLQLAREFDRLSGATDKQAAVRSVIAAMSQSNPSAAPDPKLERFLVGIMESEEYALGKAQAYMKLFSENDLKQLIEMARSPAYILMQAKRQEMILLLAQNMLQLVEAKLPRFEQSGNRP